MPRDKVLHFLAGVSVAFLASLVLPLTYAVGLAVVVGIVKEAVWDWMMDRGTPEALDVLATAAGAFLVWILLS